MSSACFYCQGDKCPACPRMLRQKITSARTSIPQVPAMFRKIPWEKGLRNLDYGGGRYDFATWYLRTEHGVENYVYDPYNRSDDHNRKTLAQGYFPTITMANVLNVIAEDTVVLQVLRHAAESLVAGGSLFIGVYEGDKTGVGRETPKGYQRNMRAKDYRALITQALPGWSIVWKHGFYTCVLN